jgi:hypothetical protein
MHKRGRRAQNWSIEVIIALSIFVVIFVLASAFMFYLPTERSQEFRSDTRQILTTLENDVELIDSAVINEDELNELSAMSCDELRDLLQITGQVCIHFETLDGTAIRLDNGGFVIGCGDISIVDGILCGESAP